MKWIKYGIAALLFAIFAFGITLGVVLANLDDEDYLSAAQWLLLKTAGVRLTVADDFHVKLGWETIIRAQGIQLLDATAQADLPPVAKVQALKVRVALKPMIGGTLVLRELKMSDAVITLPGRAKGTEVNNPSAISVRGDGAGAFFLPVFEHVQIARTTLVLPIRRRGPPIKIWVEQFNAIESAKQGPPNQVVLTGLGHIDTMPYRIDGTIGTVESFLKRDTPYPLDVTVGTYALTTRVSGTVQRRFVGSDLALKISSQGSDLSRVLGLLGVAGPSLGKVDLNAVVGGTARKPQVSDLKLTVRKATGLNVAITGEISDLLRFQGFDLAVAGNCKDPDLLAWLLPAKVPPVEAIELKGTLKDHNRSFFITCAPLILKGPQGARLEGTGRVWVGQHEGAPDPQNQIDLQLALRAPSVAAPFEPAALPEVLESLRPVNATGTLKGRFNALSLDNVSVKIGDDKTVMITAAGAVDQIRVKAKQPVSGVSFKGNAAVVDPTLLAPKVAAQLAGTGPFRGRFTIVDAQGRIKLKDTLLTSEAPAALTVGIEGTVFPWNEFQLELLSRVSSADLAALSGLDEVALPDFKAIDLKMVMARQDRRWDATTFEVRCFGTQKEALVISGRLHGLFGDGRTVLTASFDGDLTQVVFPSQGPRFNLLEGVQGKVSVSKDADGYMIEQLDAGSDGLGDLSIRASGSIQPSATSYFGDLQVRFEITDPQVLLAVYGVTWPQAQAVKIDGGLKGNPSTPEFSGTVVWGDNQTAMHAAADLTGSRPRIQIDATSKAYRLTGLSRRSLSLPANTEKASAKNKGGAVPLFSKTPLQLKPIKDVDLVIKVQAGEMSIAGLDLEAVDLNFRQEEGRLAIRPLAFNYAGGAIDLDFSLETSKPVPQWTLDLKAKHVDLQRLLTDWNRTAPIGGQLNVALDVKSQGLSAHDIASALTGEAGFAIANGWIPHGVDLLAGDIFDALLTLPSANKQRVLNCLVARFDFQKGIGASRVLSIDTDDFSALGGGKIDLRNETLDLLINPRQKKRLVLSESSPVRIFGPLTDLSFSKMPYREAAKLYGDIIMPFIGISDRILGYLWDALTPDEGEESPCYIKPDEAK